MKAGGQIYTPYSCLAFDVTADGTAATDIEHIVALAEAHDSRIADDRRRDIASDLDNLTIADPTVNRSQKSDRDAAEWMPARHGGWFAERVILVKAKYGLSVDPAERDALEELLAGGGAELSCVEADTSAPTVTITSSASAPVNGPFSITITFSEPVTGFDVGDLVIDNGTVSNQQGNEASYTATITPTASGTVTVDIPAGAAEDSAGNPNSAAMQFSITADTTGPSNRAPEPVGRLAGVTIGVDEAAVTVEVSGAFRDPDGDTLTYVARSSAPTVASVSVLGSRVTVTPVSEGTALVTVTATDPGGSNMAATQAFTVTVPRPFTDHPIVPGVTRVKAVHFTELRTRIDALRSTVSVGRFPWTDPVLSAEVTRRVRLVHLLELRSALDAAYAAAGRSAPFWTDAAPTSGRTPIRAVHLLELRAAVVGLE